jgi:O-antigen/teichoic acid export membrane protein
LAADRHGRGPIVETRSSAQAAALQTGSQLLVAFTGYVTAVVVARQLGPGSYGAYSMVYSVLLAFEIIGRLGLPQALTKLVAERVEGRLGVERTGLALGAALYLTLFALFWLAAPYLAEVLEVEGGSALFRIAALDIPFYGILFMALGVLNGRGRFAAAALATAVYALAKLVGILLLAWPGVTIEGALLVNAAGSAVGLGTAVLLTGAAAWRPAFAETRRLVAFAVPVSMRGVALTLLSGIGLWSLGVAGAAVPDEARGLYAAAASVARLPTVLAVGVTGVLVGGMAAALGRDDRAAALELLSGTMRALLVLLVPAAVIVVIEAEGLMRLVFAERYAAGGRLLAILVVGQGLLGTLLIVLTSALVAASRAGLAAAAAGAGLLLAALAAAILVPPLGAMGAAIATTLGCALATAGAGMAAIRRIGRWLEPALLLRLVAATAPVAALATALTAPGGWLLLELTGLSLLQLALLLAAGAVRGADLRRLLERP